MLLLRLLGVSDAAVDLVWLTSALRGSGDDELADLLERAATRELRELALAADEPRRSVQRTGVASLCRGRYTPSVSAGTDSSGPAADDAAMNSTSSRKEDVMFKSTATSLAFFAVVLTVGLLGMILVGSASAGTGKATFNDFTFTHQVDKASPVLAK